MLKRILGAGMLFMLLAAFAAANEWEIDAPGRVVAFGDVHGAYDDWVALLQELEVIDSDLDWRGGDTHLVSLGDLIDRGPGSRDVVRLMMKLDAQAAAAGGAVHIVLGNHEVMVMTGDLSYVSTTEFAAFAADETPAMRDAEFAAWRAANAGVEEGAAREAFEASFPAGYFALRRAYAPNGELGKWLVSQPFVLRVNDKVYMHGGIPSDLAEESLAAINQRMQGELSGYVASQTALRDAGVLPWHINYVQQLVYLNGVVERFSAENPGQRPAWFDPLVALFEAQEALIFSDNAPNWYRGSAWCHPYAESFNTERFLKRVGARQLVIGHTPSRGQVIERMEGQVIRLDTGMLTSVYGGRAAALISGDGDDYVHYLGGERAVPIIEKRDLAMSMSGMPDEELEEFMRTAEITATEDIDTGVTKPKRVTQVRGDFTNDAAFKYEDTTPGLEGFDVYVKRRHDKSDRYIYDVAAYRLDRLLDLQMVPTTVLAEIDGQQGALSDWMEGTINERDRVEQEVPFTGYCDQYEQYRLRYVFDILTYNEDRNLTNILWTKDKFMLRFIDHSLAFRSKTNRPKQYRRVDLRVSDLLYRKLEALDDETLQREMAPYLHPTQIEAMIKRRDRILKDAIRTGRR